MINEEIKTLLRAIADGKQMQYSCQFSFTGWKDCNAEDATFGAFKMIAGDSDWKVRIKPEPLECWVNVYDYDELGKAYKSKELAQQYARAEIGHRVIHMREVIE